MKSSFPSAVLPNVTALLLILTISGCLSMPRFSPPTTSQMEVAAGPPVWEKGASPFERPSDSAAVAEAIFGDEDDDSDTKPDDIPASRRTDRVASRHPMPKLVADPAQFEWKDSANSSGDRNIQTAVIGQGGYRTLLIGSLAGNDTVAIKLAERLARHLHQNQIILGGIQLTVIRNLNPDGEANEVSVNSEGVYLNRLFPEEAATEDSERSLPAELQYLMQELRTQQPQRVIHLRTIGREQGVVAASSGAVDVAKDVSGWLGFQLMKLPGTSAPGTVERYLSEIDQCDIVTLAVPEDAKADEAWDLYSDAVLNLLMDEDFATRKLARQRKNSKAADRRGSK